MGSLSKREKTMVMALIVLFIGFLYYRYALTPQLNKLANEKRALEVNQQKLEDLKLKEKQLEKMKSEVEKITAKADEVSSQIPDYNRIPELIVSLRDITNSSGCTAGVLTFGSPSSQSINSNKNSDKNKDGGADTASGQSEKAGKAEGGKVEQGSVMVLPINYAITGDYDAVMKFIGLVESNNRILLINSMNIGRDQKAGLLSVSLGMDTLYRESGDPQQPIQYQNLNLSAGKADMFN